MTDQPVLIGRRGGLGTVTLNRPEARNPLDGPLAEQLLAAFEDFFTDPEIRAIALAANGSAFCAGGDLRQMQSLADMPAEEAYAWPGAIVEVHKRMLDAPKPVIALVDGPAYAGGMGLAGMCDVVLATPRASFSMPEVKIGMFPMIIIAHLVRSMPRKLLFELMLTGDVLDVEEAHRVSFVRRICTDVEDMWRVADEYAQTFARNSPHAIGLGRKAFTLIADMPAYQALDTAQFLNLAFFHGSDIQEGAVAFLEKRPPRWSAGE